MEPITNLRQALTYLSLGGAAAAASTVTSILLEKWAAFNSLAAGVKLAITMGISLLLGWSAVAALTLPDATLQAAQPYFSAAVLALAPFIIQEIAHRLLKKAPVVSTTVTSVAPESTTTTVSTDTLAGTTVSTDVETTPLVVGRGPDRPILPRQ